MSEEQRPPNSGRVRVTVEFLDDPESCPARFEADMCEVSADRGLQEKVGSITDPYPEYEPNGQYRFQVRGWIGCPTYDLMQSVV